MSVATKPNTMVTVPNGGRHRGSSQRTPPIITAVITSMPVTPEVMYEARTSPPFANREK